MIELRHGQDKQVWCACGNRSDPLDLDDALAHFIGTEEAFDPLIVASETRAQPDQFFSDVAKNINEVLPEASRLTIYNVAERAPNAIDIAWDHDIVLTEQTCSS